MSRDQINIRCGHEMKMYLLNMDNYSNYVRELVDRDRLDRLDSTLINNKIKEHQEAIKELQGLKKTKSVDQDKIQELLAYHAPAFKQNAMVRSETQRIRFIEKAIMPGLKKLGYKGSPQEIDEILINWPEADQ